LVGGTRRSRGPGTYKGGRDRRLGAGRGGDGRLRTHGAWTRSGCMSPSGMVIAGLGMGLLQPVYTLGGCRTSRPRRQMGRPRLSSTIFLSNRLASNGRRRRVRLDHADRAIHSAFRAVDAGARASGGAAVLFANPFVAGPGQEADGGRVSAAFPGGPALLQTLFDQNVRASLASGPAPHLRLQRRHHDRGGAAAPGPAQASLCARRAVEPELATL